VKQGGMPDRVKSLTEIQGINYNIGYGLTVRRLVILLRRVINAAVAEPISLKA